MKNLPKSAVKEQYLLRSTFFYKRLSANGYFNLFLKVQKYSDIEGATLEWDKRRLWGISNEAWDILNQNNISPILLFVHPKVLYTNPSFLKYYRSVAMIPQKGLKSITGISNVDSIENGKVEAQKLSKDTINNLVNAINEILSLVIVMASNINKKEIEGMMYATAGTNIDGSWRNQIGSEGERVIRTIILKGLDSCQEITSVIDKDNMTHKWGTPESIALSSDIDKIKTINLVNGCSVLFASEPDVTMCDSDGSILGIIEIKSGLDPAGALERLGAMLKSFVNTLSEYPRAVTILVASCITKELDSRLNASMAVRQRYITADITSNDREKRKFVNKLRVILKLEKNNSIS